MQSAHNGAATTRIAAKVEERRLLRRRRARGKLSRARPPRLNSGARAQNWVRPARREARVPNGAARWPRPAAVESHAGTLSGSTAAATPRTATRPHRSPPAAELLVQPRCPGGRRGR
ncbi:unnamed protein product [Prorocentrum cordatum]|uniref:Uncharacterized protein n=1 Tax=Prorocentrum cordatum TaxID=2364126 RepID=A0ABN9YEY7_9DINO|nr:unnamed protein product [Polarella glacialis]